ncbi:MAG: sugar phosphate isomerase/epimerase family protein [Halobacteriaceae archaeon]
MDPWPTGATVSGFGNEIHPDLGVQLDVLAELGVETYDLRSVGGTNVAALSDEEVDTVADALAERGMSVGGIGSPIGKVNIEGGQLETASRTGLDTDAEGFEAQLEVLDRVLAIADRLEADHVRVFSYYLPDGDDPADHRAAVLERFERKVERAAAYDVPLLHENMPGIYGDTPERVRDLMTTIDSPYLRTIYEPANFYGAGVEPFPDSLLLLAEYVRCVHVKDTSGAGDWATDEDVEITVVGDGDLDWPGILDALYARGFDGAFALEPHLSMDDTSEGLSGPDPFRRAARAFESAFRAAEERAAAGD